ncbi:polysaccharide biosynthesis tyrosine autokinase [Actinomycetospora sp. CA-053990]|uniref:polysaccharide biosynthesis tyrosine autokinase n=1 Tax=Actinomycetospora sp. CA-053990 TaxID=3239891 RepID=UPI003D8E8B3E
MNTDRTIKVVRERWKLVAAGVLVGLVGALLYATLTPRQYSATVTMYVSASDVSNATTAYQGGLLSEQRVTSYVQLLTGGRIADEVSRQLNLGGSPEELSNQISAAALPDSVILTASVLDRDPIRAAMIANAVGDSFTRLVAELEQPQNRSQPPSVSARVVQPAAVPFNPVAPQPAVGIGTGLLLGLVVGLGVAFFLDSRDKTVKSDDELTALLETPTLTVVPLEKEDGSRAGSLSSVRRVAAESYRRLRANLQFIPFKVSGGRALVVTSTLSGEGKTTTVVQLGIAMGEAGRRVVVVDGDLRKPALAERLNVDQLVGLTSILTGRAATREVIAHSRHENLWVIPSGPVPPNPSELLGTEKMAALLEELCLSFDYVLVDSPPIGPVVDAAVTANLSDGVLLVARHGYVQQEQLVASRDSISAASGRLLGTIFTMVPVAKATYGAYYSYGAAEGQVVERAASIDDSGTTTDTISRRPSPAPRR